MLFALAPGADVQKDRSEYQRLPLRALNVTIDANDRERFFEQLREFSDQNGFAIRIARTTPSGNFNAQMWREDIRVTAVNPFEEGKYRVRFYRNNAPIVDDAVLDRLVSILIVSLKDKGFAVEEREI